VGKVYFADQLISMQCLDTMLCNLIIDGASSSHGCVVDVIRARSMVVPDPAHPLSEYEAEALYFPLANFPQVSRVLLPKLQSLFIEKAGILAMTFVNSPIWTIFFSFLGFPCVAITPSTEFARSRTDQSLPRYSGAGAFCGRRHPRLPRF
jgi:hypothetical protein